MEELIKELWELHQINIYSVDGNWCIQLFDLDVCPNDYDIQPCPEFECVFGVRQRFLLFGATHTPN
ncbi:TPA: hypothetical protein ACGN81_005333 [Bacillus cereus]